MHVEDQDPFVVDLGCHEADRARQVELETFYKRQDIDRPIADTALLFYGDKISLAGRRRPEPNGLMSFIKEQSGSGRASQGLECLSVDHH